MAPPACRYATLSYVWGGTADNYALATTSNIRALEEEGYLFKQPLPATIRDSIRACIELKIRYLWIDRLCIVQDDTAAVKNSQINAMGDIYSHSYLTLVDLEGANMDHGLPGVSQARAVRMTYKIPGMSLRIIDEEYPKLVKKSKWNSRGWIFQEAMLSPRMLMFANDFTSRDFTFSADILKALSGVMHSKFGTEHYFGLPYSEFLGGMLWSPRGLSALETPEVRSTETGDIFPTWSWSSVITPVEVYSGAGRGSFVVPGIMLGAWGIPSSKTKKLVHIIPSHNPRPSWYEPQSYEGIGIALMWKEGCFPKPSPSMLNISTTWKNLLALIMSRWASANKLIEEALGIASSSGKMHFERMSCLFYMENADQPGALLSHTQSIHAQIVKRGDQECPSPAIEGYVHLILHSISEIEVDLWIRPNPLHWQFLDHDYSTDHCTKVDVLALSMMYEKCDTYRFPDEWGLWYDSEGSFLGSDEKTMVKFVVNVLIVETRDGLSRRVAIGAVELHDWIAASPDYRNFTLV
ncbi:hypothetical protein AtubIFM54640_010997 [Aspergillus tubingensis]|nr:hypothetical protein AtubIFM54640_010997 [Aspergillus tubingensis]GLB22334.1 hypothetical protein AtubIFM61612_002897 [Aspergillus tubingensis]